MSAPDDTADRVREWATRTYCSGTPLDQDRRMVAAETEAFLSGRGARERSELTLAAKFAGPVDPPTPADEPTEAEVRAVMKICRTFYSAPVGVGPQFARAVLVAAREVKS